MKKFLLALCAVTVLFACTKDKKDDTPKGAYEGAALVLNEGGYNKGNASLSVIKNDTLTNGVFNAVTGLDLGDTAQSIAFEGDNAYIVVNGSNKIEVVNRYTLETVTTITENLMNPRYIAFNDDKAYVTNWGDGTKADDDFVTVINLKDYTTSKISVTEGPEAILEHDDKLYIAHKGGYSQGNTISVFDTDNNTVEATIEVGFIPASIIEEDDNIYVLCSGKAAWTGDETKGGIYKIKTSDNTVSKSVELAEGLHPSNLVEADDKLYYTIGSSVYTTDLSLAIPSDALFKSKAEALYGLGINDNKIYVADAIDYASSGKTFVYTTEGTLLKEYTVGVLPNGFYFND